MLDDEITTQSEKLFKQSGLQLSKNRTPFTEWWRASGTPRSPVIGQALCHVFLPTLRFRLPRKSRQEEVEGFAQDLRW